MKNGLRRLSYILTGAWMSVIWWMSADSSSGIKSLRIARMLWEYLFTPLTGIHPSYPVLFETDALLRKSCHVGEYAIMAGLYLWSLSAAVNPLPWMKRLRWTLLLTVFWAATDELHQAFVPGRGAHVTDVLIDSCGAALVLCGAILWDQRRQRRTAEPTIRQQPSNA